MDRKYSLTIILTTSGIVAIFLALLSTSRASIISLVMATVAFGGRLGVPNQVGTFDHLEALNDGSGPPIPALDDIGNNADSCRSERRAVLSWEELRGRLEALTDEEDHVTLGLKFEETLSITIPRENLRGNLPKPGRMVSILRTDTEWVVRES